MGSEHGLRLTALPFALGWLGRPQDWTSDGATLSITAPRATDWFVDPGTGEANLGAPALVGRVTGDVVLSARVAVRFASTYDAGALVAWRDERSWAKLCLEY